MPQYWQLSCLCHLLQIVVQGIPWGYTWTELKEMFADVGSIERADVAMGSDGRSRVSPMFHSRSPYHKDGHAHASSSAVPRCLKPVRLLSALPYSCC